MIIHILVYYLEGRYSFIMQGGDQCYKKAALISKFVTIDPKNVTIAL